MRLSAFGIVGVCWLGGLLLVGRCGLRGLMGSLGSFFVFVCWWSGSSLGGGVWGMRSVGFLSVAGSASVIVVFGFVVAAGSGLVLGAFVSLVSMWFFYVGLLRISLILFVVWYRVWFCFCLLLGYFLQVMVFGDLGWGFFVVPF